MEYNRIEVHGNFCPLPAPNGVVYSDGVCFIEHEGRSFGAGGTLVTEDYCIGYPEKGGKFKTFDGTPIGAWYIRSSWRVHSYIGTTMYQIEVTIIVDGEHRTYTGRGFGEGMLYRGKRTKRQSPNFVWRGVQQ